VIIEHFFAVNRKDRLLSRIMQIEIELKANAIQCTKGTKDERGAQIDLILDRDDDVINLCEIKFTREPFIVTSDYYNQVLVKSSRFIRDNKPSKAVRQILISVNGVKRNEYSDEFQTVITLDSLFAPYLTI